MDTIAANHNPNPVAGADQQSLRQRLISAWGAIHPWAGLPTDWLDAAVIALSTPTHNEACPKHEHTDAREWVTCQEDTLAELRRLHTATRIQESATAQRREELADLQTWVRRRALAQLRANPGLAQPLREALADWGLPPIPTDSAG